MTVILGSSENRRGITHRYKPWTNVSLVSLRAPLPNYQIQQVGAAPL